MNKKIFTLAVFFCLSGILRGELLQDTTIISDEDSLIVYQNGLDADSVSLIDTLQFDSSGIDSIYLHEHVDSLQNLMDSMQVMYPDSIRPDSLAMDSTASDSVKLVTLRKIENNAFHIGEHLVFEIAYGFIKAGTATMSVVDTTRIQGRSCYHIVTTAKSNKFFSTFFKVRDRVESFIDVEGIFTWRFEKHLREGKYRADKYADYDQFNHRVYLKKDTLEIPPYVQDVLSTFYYVRTQSIEVDQYFDITNHSGKKIYPIRVLVHKKERIEVPAGSFQTIVVEPIMREEGLFKQKGRLKVWLTDDERKIPVLMKSKALIGSINAKLKEYTIKN